MKISITGQKEGDLLIQMTAWVGLTVSKLNVIYISLFFCFKSRTYI
jgi:hypothetical protein